MDFAQQNESKNTDRVLTPPGQNHTCKFPRMWLVHGNFSSFRSLAV